MIRNCRIQRNPTAHPPNSQICKWLKTRQAHKHIIEEMTGGPPWNGQRHNVTLGSLKRFYLAKTSLLPNHPLTDVQCK